MSSCKVVSYVSAVLVIFGAVLPSIVSAGLIAPSGLAVWLDAQDVDGDGIASNNPANGTAVGTWVDKASLQGTQSAVQTTGTSQPLYYSDVLNGQAAIRFDGSDYLAAPDVALGPFTYFTVFKATTQSSMIYERSTNADVTGNGEFLYTDINMSFETMRDAVKSGKNVSSSWGATSPNQFLLVENSFNGTNASNLLFVGGAQVGVDVVAQDPGLGVITDTLYVGQRAGTAGEGWGLNGDLAEMLVFNRVLTDAERNTVGSYLTEKYGLTTAYTIPEPGTLVLSVMGLIGLLAYAWRKRR